MPASCCHAPPAGYRRVLWLALAINAAMFATEIGAGLAAGSVALLADALDFAGDAANYAISLFVLGLGLRWRAGAALLKGLSMGAFGLWLLAAVAHRLVVDGVPSAPIMGGVGALALAANIAAALLLFRYRDGDANMRSVWLCSRNDALGNLAVMAAASGVFATGAGWPDLAVAAAMAGLALAASLQVVRRAGAELRPAAIAAGD
jgi:Co/Zn/Cd efflux system component